VGDNPDINEGTQFTPRFDQDGLIPAIAQDANTGEILMVAYMNAESLELTRKTGFAVYFSRSRKRLWKKGEESGHMQRIERILVDCDQDCLVLKVRVDSGQCHVGYQSCFYRALDPATGQLEFVADRVFDPASTYRKK